MKKIAYIIFIFFLPINTFPKDNVIKINTSTGLYTNHVYCAIKDQMGYLWIATSNGVYKYNGYNLYYFGNEKGLPNNDVWNLFEDQKGRIWLMSITSSIGYIYKNRYYNVYKKNDANFYPSYFNNYSDGVFFINISHPTEICIEKNDSIICRSYCLKNDSSYFGALYYSNNNFYCNIHNSIYQIGLSTGGIKLIKKYGSTHFTQGYLTGKLLFPFSYGNENINPLPIYHIDSEKISKIHFESFDHNYMLNESSKICYLINKFHVFQLNPNMETFIIPSVDNLLNEGVLKPGEILTYEYDSLWGEKITTKNSGLLLYLKNQNNAFLKHRDNDSIKLVKFYWDSKNKTITAPNGKKTSLSNVNHIYKTLQWKNDTSLFISDIGICVAWKEKKNYNFKFYKDIWNFSDAVIHDGALYLLGSNGGVYKKEHCNSINSIIIDNHRYNGIVQDTLRDVLIAYGRENIMILRNHKKVILNAQYENIISVEKIYFDNQYRNVILKSYDKIYLVNLDKLIFKELFSEINFQSSHLILKNDKLIIAGKFGYLMSRIIGFQKFSKPAITYNYKTKHYKNVFDIEVYDDSILLLKTDKGLYKNVISKSTIPEDVFLKYRLVIQYDTDYYTYHSIDTLTIHQKDKSLFFDLIAPMGVGKVTYQYKIKDYTNWAYLPNNELSLNNVRHGYQTIQVCAKDDVLRTKVFSINVYIKPLWWQTLLGKTFIVAIGIILFITIILITKTIINRKNLREHLKLEVKNLHLSLELKSLYAQLNPHFIFNSLGTALYLIKSKKTDAAYKHVASFAELLRSYLKSSKEKYIRLSEEIINIENYIQLQQSRFENKFDYQIMIDENVNPYSEHLPSLLLQPIIENAINHGLLNKEGKGNLFIGFQKEKEHTLLCTIDDNGVGRQVSNRIKAEKNIQTTSMGNDIVSELVNIQNNSGDYVIQIEYYDKEAPDTGTKVIILIHKKKKE